MIEFTLWGILLIIQNAAFTLVSRARNSNSVSYHAIAALGSNGIWFASQLILVQNFLEVLKTGSWLHGLGVGLFYTVCTLVGSVGMHYLALNKIERKIK